MHMADALISPLTGVTMLAVTTGLAVYSARQLQSDLDEKKIPLMGVMGAFVFAAQMINFTIPATGSSGHIGGGMLLAALLGPYAAFLTMASVLLIQALFFADGGLLAYGCNVFNLGFWPCLLAYPTIYKFLTRRGFTARSIWWASLTSVVIALQMGALSVALETLVSGKTELPFLTFILLMQPIHLGIGVVEGLVTAAILVYVWKARPEILAKTRAGESLGRIRMRKVLTTAMVAAVLLGGALSGLASTNPDGLEWSVEKAAGTMELQVPDGVHKVLANLQDRSSFFPDYGFNADNASSSVAPAAEETVWPSPNTGTSLSGVVGGGMTLVLAVLIGWVVKSFKQRNYQAAVWKNYE